jgi:hypothetical protein
MPHPGTILAPPDAMTPTTLRRTIAAALLATAGACGSTTEPDPLVGTYLATTFQISQPGQSTANVLAAGGSLGLNVANNYVTTGTLIVPASLAGGTTFTASMAGIATKTGATVIFSQSADSFVRDLTFTLVESRLEARSQTLGSTTYDIVLSRQ